MLSPQNELTCFIYSCINLFFGIKFDLEELNNDVMEKAKRIIVIDKPTPVTEESKMPTKVLPGIFSFAKFAQANKPLAQNAQQAKLTEPAKKTNNEDTPSSDSDDVSEDDEQLFGMLLNDQRN